MLNNHTTEGLKKLRLSHMARGLAEQLRNPEYEGIPLEERLGMLVDAELTERENSRRERNLRAAKMKERATVEGIDFGPRRGLDRAQVLGLAQGRWVEAAQSVLVTGATGVGKTYVACALATAAIRCGYSALYLRAPRLFEMLEISRADGRYASLMGSLARTGVLVIDDLALRPLSTQQAADLLEIIEDRHSIRAMIIASQLPVASWHSAMGEEQTVADAIMDRVLSRAHRIEMGGESRRSREVDQTDSQPSQ